MVPQRLAADVRLAAPPATAPWGEHVGRPKCEILAEYPKCPYIASGYLRM
jgi:hypothetical protein